MQASRIVVGVGEFILREPVLRVKSGREYWEFEAQSANYKLKLDT